MKGVIQKIQMDGPDCSKKALRGRPKKKPGYDKEQHIQNLIDQAVALFGEPYDDRIERPDDAPTITTVAEAMGTSRIRVRKMLITADYYSTEISRTICEMVEHGISIPEICERTGLGRAAVHSYLPYEKGAYNLKDLSVNAEQCRHFQQRKKACEKFRQHLNDEEHLEYLWEAILAFENYPFKTEDGRKFRYRMEHEIIIWGCGKISRKDIENTYCLIRQLQDKNGYVTENECLENGGSPELYAIFLRIGACCKLTEKLK